MPVPDKFPPIETLIPHRGTMLLLDKVLEFNDERIVAEYAPQQKTWYADEAGNMPAWIGIELMAQAIAAHVALVKQQDGLPPKLGALLGTRSYQTSVASFPCGRSLRIQVYKLLRDASGLGAYDCAISLDGVTQATAILKVYEPENFEIFVQGSHT